VSNLVRNSVGVCGTIVWVAVAAYLLRRDPAAMDAMKPSDWGDFLAGVSAPIAFLWLVLGYFQQSEELRLSTQALRLQADELKNSVKQQTAQAAELNALVEVTKQQFQTSRDLMELEKRKRELELRPAFSVTGRCEPRVKDDRFSYVIDAKNSGYRATDFRAEYRSSQDDEWRDAGTTVSLANGAAFSLLIPLQKLWSDGRLRLSCKDGQGEKYEVEYRVLHERRPHLEFVTVAVRVAGESAGAER